MRKIRVAFHSAKVAFLNSFAERKTTMKNRTMLTFDLLPFSQGRPWRFHNPMRCS